MTDSKSGSETSRRASATVVAVGLVVGALLLAAGGIVALGVGPFGADNGTQTTPTGPTATPNENTPGENHVRPFTIDIRSIEKCGETCRDVTVAITNNGGNARENVTVTTNIYAGNDTVWNAEESVGTLASDASRTETKRIDVGLVGGAKIKQNDGEITIETVVRWEGGSATFSERRDVT
ncbi:hypothetical protein EGH21_07850 [Halomicroarcula sp. F13]|uniref:DUF4352 domain-containing protein n=1 Tax=Haloarcula rubra TaxID=2487747 RepID=A0AAW4PPB4_9EURY|nr:hypothetical protein [Halomicroarcula rubra]MBX0322939.1 hypothetical protein [Halomicroarcula rubra]